MGAGLSLLLVMALSAIPLIGVSLGLHFVFAVVIPYASFLIFLLGVIYRIVAWARSPVPFCIPATCGQQKSLPWIKNNKLDNPSGTRGVLGRMALEICLFRSLLRNVRFQPAERGPIAYYWEKWLWLFALLFHWSLFVIVVRHLRLLTEPVPAFVGFLGGLDGFFGFGLHSFYLTDVLVLAALTFLLLRRVMIPFVRYVSLPADYFPLFLILGVAVSGVLMKYLFRVDIVAVKQLILGLAGFHPAITVQVGAIFYLHLFLISFLFAYFPFSKLMHAGGIFLSPTRNMANNSRMRRHINPWNYPVRVHTYAEYEDEFRKVMQGAGLPVEKESGPV